jgi:hypothetical protein
VTFVDFSYSVYAFFGFLAPKDFLIIWLSNFFTLSVPEEG